ncbi:MAG: hypothetical protein R3C69_02830 [Geminicoccaceae bacterium]
MLNAGNVKVAALVAASLRAAAAASADDQVERGRYLVETIAACGNCHTPMGPDGPDASRHLAGGQVIDMGVFRRSRRTSRRTLPPASAPGATQRSPGRSARACAPTAA